MQADHQTTGADRLRNFIEQESELMRRTLRFYVSRAGLADRPPQIEALADELLNDVTVEALAHADRFRPDGQPRAWLLGIAANLIKRRQADHYKRQSREPLARDLLGDAQGVMSEDELFDRLAQVSDDNPSVSTEAADQLQSMLAPLAAADREIIRMAVLAEMDGKALAAVLNITPGAARVRLHRALNRLRQSLAGEVAHG